MEAAGATGYSRGEAAAGGITQVMPMETAGAIRYNRGEAVIKEVARAILVKRVIGLVNIRSYMCKALGL